MRSIFRRWDNRFLQCVDQGSSFFTSKSWFHLENCSGGGGGNWRDLGSKGVMILTSSEIATEKELWSWKSEGMSEEICPLGECNNYSYLQILLILLLSSIYL